MSPPTCIIIPLHTKAITKLVDPTSTPSHYSRLSCYDHRIMPFIDDEMKEGIEHVSDKVSENGMEDDKDSYEASMHSSTLKKN